MVEEGKYSKMRLYTPGPLSTSDRVRQTLNVDFGSRDGNFTKYISLVQKNLLEIGGLSPESYECVLIQGCGTMCVEAVIGSVVPKTPHHLVVLANGAYGRRHYAISQNLGISSSMVEFKENDIISVEAAMIAIEGVEKEKDSKVTHVVIIHGETTSGLINPVSDIGEALHKHNPAICYIIDSMSAFGAYIPDFERGHINYLVSSANKCISGVPGFAYALCRLSHLNEIKGWNRSLSLSLYDNWVALRDTKQFKFTPPCQIIRAFYEAIAEFLEEGGVQSRYITKEMEALGFKPYLPKEIQGCVITTFYNPTDPNFKFKEFYDFLAAKNLFIYPGKFTKEETFRIGTIGHLFMEDMEILIAAIKDALTQLGVQVPVKY